MTEPVEYLSELTLLEELGAKFELDWDNELLVTVPDSEVGEAIAPIIERCTKQLTRYVFNRAASMKRRCYGGPLNGREHGHCSLFCERFAWRESRAKWAVYELMEDGRAYFKGYASSEQKGRRGQFKVAAAELRTEVQHVSE